MLEREIAAKNKKEKGKEKCPLCKISKETIERLKMAAKQKESEKEKEG